MERQFREFHDNNPDVYKELVRLSRKAVKAGKRKIGISMLWEVLRWHFWLKTTDEDSEFKLNNNHRSRYARLIMKNESGLVGIFETRKLKSP